MDAFIGEIRAFANSYYPEGWLPCNGCKISIQQYQALFSVIGTNFGDSDGRTYFTLPNLQGMTIVGAGQSGGSMLNLGIGETAGTETAPLINNNLAPHNHSFKGVGGGLSTARTKTADSTGTSHISNFLFQPQGSTATPVMAPGYLDQQNNPVTLNPATIGGTGGLPNGSCQAHENRSPYLVINYYICVLDGYYPPRP